MNNADIEVRVKDRILKAKGKKLILDESFFSAGILRILNRKKEIALELKYQNKADDFLIEEGERVYNFLKRECLTNKIEVNSGTDGLDFPTVALTGNYKGIVYS